MSSTGVSNDSTILKLRVKGSDLDPLALRGRLQNLLGEISFQPRLPPSATLFIRKLNDPLPGLLQLDTTHPRAPEAWRHAFNSKFEQLVSSAARPAHGLVGDSAESVVFYDYAELLASLTADWCRGDATTRWWWKSLVQCGDVWQLIRRLWREKVEYVPAALELLVKRDVIVEFVSRLSEDEVRVLVQRVVHVFALREIRHVLEPRIFRIAEPDLVRESRGREETPGEFVVPWKHIVPEADTPRLGLVQLFVGIALMIRRAPVRVRTLSFAKEVEEWSKRVGELASVGEQLVDAQIEDVVREFPERAESVVHDTIPGMIVEDSVADVSIAPIPPKREREQVKIGNAVFSYEEPVVIPEASVEPQPILANQELIVRAPEIEPVELQTPMTPREPLDAITIETELGGLFYLINLAIFLDIYNDFTSPEERITTDLSIWHFIALAGADLDPDVDDEDPIWSLFNQLADPENPVAPVKPGWLTELLPNIRTRLGKLTNLLLHHHAKVIITATHLDVFFALNQHPIELRISGLDRDPGWVPAAGRFIAFHYD